MTTESMSKTHPELTNLLGKKIENSDFSFQVYTEIYERDGDGQTNSIGFLKNGIVAKAIAEERTEHRRNVGDNEDYMTRELIILTNGKIGYQIVPNKSTTLLLDDKKEAEKIRQAALKKLNTAEKAILGL